MKDRDGRLSPEGQVNEALEASIILLGCLNSNAINAFLIFDDLEESCDVFEFWGKSESHHIVAVLH